jgi:hypothetical protein
MPRYKQIGVRSRRLTPADAEKRPLLAATPIAVAQRVKRRDPRPETAANPANVGLEQIPFNLQRNRRGGNNWRIRGG